MSHLTTQQKATIKAFILADPVLGPLSSGPGTDYGAIAAAMSANASPIFTVWKTSVAKADVLNQAAFDWTRVDNMSVGKARIWDQMFSVGNINAAQANIRAGIDATWVGTAADLAVRAAVYVACKRPATLVEKLFATGVGSDASPATLTFEGGLDIQHVNEIFTT